MLKTILRKEHKNKWERRTPLTPDAVNNLNEINLRIDVESSDVRIFEDSQYQISGLQMYNTPDNHQLIIGIKEPPVDSIQKEQVHLCFSHTMKGQDYNMPLLQKFIDQKATLLDYELMADETGKRTIAFGRHAGIAGAIDTFWIAGQKLDLKACKSGLSDINQTVTYKTIESAKAQLANIDLQSNTAVRVLIIGSGNVGKGAEEVCQWLGLPKLEAELFLENNLPEGSWYSVLSSSHLHQRVTGGDFDYQEYLQKGKGSYKSLFGSFLGRFDIVLQTSYWTDFYPKHLTREQFIEHKNNLPWVLGDITCDIDGSFECTKKASTIDKPAFTYHPANDSITDGVSLEGITVMSIDNLPCELSLDASQHFSAKLEEYSPYLMKMNLHNNITDINLPDELKKAVIVYKGELTDDFQYLNEYL